MRDDSNEDLEVQQRTEVLGDFLSYHQVLHDEETQEQPVTSSMEDDIVVEEVNKKHQRMIDSDMSD